MWVFVWFYDLHLSYDGKSWNNGDVDEVRDNKIDVFAPNFDIFSFRPGKQTRSSACYYAQKN